VVLEDGSPAPADVVIERACNATTQAVGRTDPNGAFLYQVNSTTPVADASYPSSDRQVRARTGGGFADGASARSALMGCELRVSLPGFQSDSVPLYDYGPYETDIDLGTIVLRQRTEEVQGYSVSATTDQAPRKARNAYENGLKRTQNGEWDEAEAQLRQAVEEYSAYAIAWETLGQVLEKQQRPTEAREAYDKAVEADGDYLSPYLLIALLAAREGNWQEMEEATEHVVKLNSADFPEAYYYQSVARTNLGDLAGAELSAREAIERGVQQQHPHVVGLLGLVLAAQGRFAEASEYLDRYLELDPDGDEVERVRNRLAEVNARIAAPSQP